MKIRHAIGFGLLVVGLATAFVLYQRQFEIEMVATVACTTVVVALSIAGSGRCCLTKRKGAQGEAWPHWMWFG